MTRHRPADHDCRAFGHAVKLSDLTESTTDALRSAGSYFADLVTPTVRLGVTGLARSGKTVFITALVRSLVAGGRLPFFRPHAEGRIVRAYLEPQPDDAVPRFSYEEHLACLASDPPRWPDSTRHISELRVTVEYDPTGTMRRMLGSSRLHIDIVDYPGEWLIDLALLDMSYADWAREALARAEAPGRSAIAGAFVRFAATLDPAAPQDEQTALTGARLYTDYLVADRADQSRPSVLGPGRFLMPGDFAGSPLLTFFPLASTSTSDAGAAKGTLAAMLERRFESYKAHVAKPFFRDHFSRLDRQIVLVDALATMNGGPAALAELEGAIARVLACFRPGPNTWLSSIFRRRVDRLLFAATKADHLHHSSHDRLEALMRAVCDRAIARASFAGAEVGVLALAALRATREAEVRQGGERLACIAGVPLAGEKLDGTTFDGSTETVLFPGDLPENPAALLTGDASTAAEVRFLRFRPPRIVLESASGEAGALPHVRLDRALEFLIGDRLQ